MADPLQSRADVETIITLTTDFGSEDAYAAAMKGVIMSINPRAIIVDISHSVRPQDVAHGAFVLSTVYSYFPDGTIHVVVVDPGVGSQRRAIILKTRTAIFVAPDNGVISYVAHHALPKRCRSSTALEELPAGWEAFEITNPRFWRHPVSSTFHGRDIFAPTAAHISRGVPFEEFGKATHSINIFPIPRPEVLEGGDLIGHVLHIDTFGNIITDVQRRDISPEEFCLEVAGQRIQSLSRTYDEANGLLAIIGSRGYLEIALKNDSAARFLGARIGDGLRITRECREP